MAPQQAMSATDPETRDRLREGRLDQILDAIDKINEACNDVAEMVARLRRQHGAERK